MWGRERGCWQVCSWFSRKLCWGSSATLALTVSLESKEALRNKGSLEKASLCHDQCILGLSIVHYFAPHF